MRTTLEVLAIVLAAQLLSSRAECEEPCKVTGELSYSDGDSTKGQIGTPVLHESAEAQKVTATNPSVPEKICNFTITKTGILSPSADEQCPWFFTTDAKNRQDPITFKIQPQAGAGLTLSLREDAKEGACKMPESGAIVLRFKLQEETTPPNPNEGCELVGDDWCESARTRAYTDHELVCVDVSASWASTKRAPPNNVMRPNRGFLLVVRHQPYDKIGVTVGGTRGLTIANVEVPGEGAAGQTESDESRGDEKRTQRGEAPVEKRCRTTLPFPPMKAGSADITLEINDTRPDSKAEPGHHVVPLEVDQAFWGSVRLGISGFYSFGGGSYEARLAPGSDQLQIYQSEVPSAGFELVVGFAPYLIDLHWGGRFYASRWRIETSSEFTANEEAAADITYRRSGNAYVAPFIGFGVVGMSGAEAVPFGSLYLGWEMEFARHFSVAIAYTLHRVTRLATGYEIGSPVDATTNFTETGPGHGIAIVLNGSPSFLQFARSGGRTASSSDGGEE
jgi:hypothetical protein